jgi:chromosome segregation ATPase
MTGDELERIMNFIIERQEHITDQQAISAEQLAQAETIMAALAQSQLQNDERLSGHDERIARFERSYTAIADLLERHDGQIVAVTSNVNKLTEVVSSLSTTVDRYIRARGNNGAGGA